MICKNCGEEMNESQCLYCGWQPGEAPINKVSLLKMLNWLADEYTEANDFLAQKNGEYQKEVNAIHAKYAKYDADRNALSGSLEKAKKECEEIKKKTVGMKYLSVLYVLCLFFGLFRVGCWLFSDLGFWDMLIQCIGAVIVLYVGGFILCMMFKKPAKKEEYDVKIKEISDLEGKIKALDDGAEKRKASCEQELANAKAKLNEKEGGVKLYLEANVLPFDFIPNGLEPVLACRAMISYLQNGLANTFTEALNVYDRKLGEEKIKKEFESKIEKLRQDSEVARVNAYHAGQKAGYQEGYKNGYNNGYNA